MGELAGPEPPLGGEMGYVVDMLSELADLASSCGEKSVAVSIRLVALQAAQARCLTGPRPQSPTAP